MFNIDKTFEFCYGHRVWSQVLDANYADDLKCACRHLHGHEAKVQVYLSAEKLERGMVTDFRHLEWLKKWLNAFVDHKFIIDQRDPLYEHLLGGATTHAPAEPVFINNLRAGWVFGVEEETTPLEELFGGVLVVDFVPTSENLAKWLHGLVQEKMNPLKVQCTRVDWWETPKSRSSYEVPFNRDLRIPAE